MTRNPRPLEESKDADLRNSMKALRRAALRAREIAIRTRTPLVISRNGVIEHVLPWLEDASDQAPDHTKDELGDSNATPQADGASAARAPNS